MTVVRQVARAVRHGDWPTVKMWLALYALWAATAGFIVFEIIRT